VFTSVCPWYGRRIVAPPPVHPSGAAAWSYFDVDGPRVREATQEYGVVNGLIDVLFALRDRLKVWFCLPDIWEMLPFEPRELTFVHIIARHGRR
jgi:hypothetical protein